MELNDSFWKCFELDMQEVKLSYLNWAIGYANEPKPEYIHLFLWDHQEDFCVINSRYGRAFAISPFGIGVRGVPRLPRKNLFKGIDEIDLALKKRLTNSTGMMREAIRESLRNKDFVSARRIVLNYTIIKYLGHELLFDRVLYQRDENGKVRRGRFGLDESEKWYTLNGIRNRTINSVRYGEHLENEYVKSLNRKLPGFSRNSKSTYLSSGLTFNRHAQCTFDAAIIMWSRSGFCDFERVFNQMRKIGWPYHGTASEVLRPIYKIGLNYRRAPIRRRGDPDEGYSLKSLKRRACKIYGKIDNLLEEIHRQRSLIE